MARKSTRNKRVLALACLLVPLLLSGLSRVGASGSGVSEGKGDRSRLTALLQAAERGDAAGVRALVASGVDVSQSTATGWTPLLAAVAGNHAEVVHILLEAGADPDTRHRYWGTPLDYAEHHGKTEIAEILRRGGARGSGKSVGDTVCVRRWRGEGFCGTVLAVERQRLSLRITSVVGCRTGCEADAVCSEGRPVGGPGLAVGQIVRTAPPCLTHTGVAP